MQAREHALPDIADNLINHAIKLQTSDIHLEPFENFYRVRFRLDGLLQKQENLSLDIGMRVIARIKLLAKLDITEKRLPQDGRLKLLQKDIRINTCPTLFGEKVVLRILDCENASLSLDTLGFNTEQLSLFKKYITAPSGLILVTGPTGSGKTVTLYSALHYLNQIEKNISTVEDPVEIQLAGINQININPKIGLTFANTLRSLLRQDPDIIMIGEIRDKETAEIAVQAAHTGHLVFSTLHTNNAIEALNRLSAMGIPNYNIVHSISLIIAQRLIRRICQTCHAQKHLSPCDACLNGYKGRTAIYEMLPFNEKIALHVLNNTHLQTILNNEHTEGYCSLAKSAREKIQNGVTDTFEISRVLHL